MAEGPTDSKGSSVSASRQGSRRELRKWERIPLDKDAAIFELDEGFTVLGNCDSSRGGVSFYSDHNFEIGRRLGLNIKNAIGLEIEVVHCEMEMVDDVFMEARYRVGAKFVGGPIAADVFSIMIRSFGA